MEVFPEKPGFQWIFSLLDSLMSNTGVGASWRFSHCWEFPNTSLWWPFPGVCRWLNSPRRASFGRDSDSVLPCTQLPISHSSCRNTPERGLLRACICSTEEWQPCTNCTGSLLNKLLPGKGFWVFLSWVERSSLSQLWFRTAASVQSWTPTSRPPPRCTVKPHFSWRIEGIEKLESLEGRSNIFPVGNWMVLTRVSSEGTYVWRGSKHRGSAPSGVRGIFGDTIYTRFRTLPGKAEGISPPRGEGPHTTERSGRWKRCCTPLRLEGRCTTLTLLLFASVAFGIRIGPFPSPQFFWSTAIFLNYYCSFQSLPHSAVLW